MAANAVYVDVARTPSGKDIFLEGIFGCGGGVDRCGVAYLTNERTKRCEGTDGRGVVRVGGGYGGERGERKDR